MSKLSLRRVRRQGRYYASRARARPKDGGENMRLNRLRIQNFKSIRDMEIQDIENVLILVGKNSAGKTVALDALRILDDTYELQVNDFNLEAGNIEIDVDLQLDGEDLIMFNEEGIVSNYRRYDLWLREFKNRLPSYDGDTGLLRFRLTVNRNGQRRYGDGVRKHNSYIAQVIPKFYYIDSMRHFQDIQDDIFLCQESEWIGRLRDGRCLFDGGKDCRRCFHCIGKIEQKTPAELNVLETARLFEYKLYQGNFNRFAESVNEYFHKNGGQSEDIYYYMAENMADLCKVSGFVRNRERDVEMPLSEMGTGMRCIYILSLLEAYIQGGKRMPCIILMEDPEIFLHPRLQKVAGEILYRLSKNNQVIFTTHSPNMLFNFTSNQIRQILMDKEWYSVARKPADVDQILDDLGYTANDLMNVNFVFIVEGKQDKSRLPLLLDKYYSEIVDEEGKPYRVAIITTNSCTNIKTYANLKYMNKLYLKDQFLMIRDGDGKDPEELAGQLCRYYDECRIRDVDKMPKVTRRNVLILKYYSFENYFLEPDIMAKIGILDTAGAFYDILFDKWKEYLYRLKCGRHFTEAIGVEIKSLEDIREHIEEFKIYMRGHNLYDIFYGRYKKREKEILKAYIDAAPREAFADILDAIDQFVYFENRVKEGIL